MNEKDLVQTSEYHLQESEIMNATAEYREGAFAFITDGTVAARELGHYGVTEPIRRGESAIRALVAGKGRKKIYGATAGDKSHLFYYDPSPIADHVVDIGILGSEVECKHLFVDGDGIIYGVTNPSGRVFRYDPAGEYSLIWTYHTNDIQWLDGGFGGEVGAVVFDTASGLMFAILRSSSKLLAYEPRTGHIEELGFIDGASGCNALAIDDRGDVFGSGKYSHLFCYSRKTGRIEVLEAQAPAPHGMEYLNYADSLLFDGDHTIYGGTTLGCVFRLDTTTREITACGRAISDHRIRALTRGNDGVIYGCAGSPHKISHMFRWNPCTGELKDLGIPMVHFPKNWVCYDISSLAVGTNGEIYIGECERTSYLFIYYPPVKKGHR